jgi:hypothetical protein
MAALVPQHAHLEARQGNRALDDAQRIGAITHKPLRHQSDEVGPGRDVQNEQER